MAYKINKYCLPSSILLCFMLFYQVGFAQYDFRPVDEWLRKNLNDLGGRAVMMVYKDGKIIYSNSLNDLSRKQEFVGKVIARRTGKDKDQVLKDYDEQTRIPIASCSKWLSAALVMTFVDEGLLTLEDTIGLYLPAVKNSGKGNITIRQCLSHTTGITAGNFKEDLQNPNNAANMEEAVVNIARQPMEAKPGEAFRYSSTGLQLAAAVIEKISGKDFETLFKERIAKPCGMSQTDFGHKKVPLAAGGAQGSALDYLHFVTMILNKGVYEGRRVLKKESVETMQLNQLVEKKIIASPAEAGSWGYGFGEWTMEDASAKVPTDAVTSPGLFGSFPWVDNKHQYAAVLFTFNLKNKGRNERYKDLKKITDSIITAAKN
jgi:CubicO group peptidase (beta-lactamase class C family)